ncbi:MAG: hypothetical protein ABII21_03800 [bacterium]
MVKLGERTSRNDLEGIDRPSGVSPVHWFLSIGLHLKEKDLFRWRQFGTRIAEEKIKEEKIKEEKMVSE